MRGDGYEPAVFEVQTQQNQRRDVVQRAGRTWWLLSAVGGSKKFSHGMVRSQKPLLLVPLYKTTATMYSYSGHLCNPYGFEMDSNNVPRSPIESIDE